MKNTLLAVIAALTVMAAPAFAQDEKPAAAAAAPASAAVHQNLSIAVVDVATLMRDSKAANDIEKQLQTMRKNFQEEVKKDEETLRASEKELAAQSKTLSKEDFLKKRQEFEKKLIDAQKKIQTKRLALDKSIGEAVNTLRTKVLNLVAKEGEKNKYDLVISRTDVVIVAKEIDITAVIMKQLNDELPSVKVKA